MLSPQEYEIKHILPVYSTPSRKHDTVIDKGNQHVTKVEDWQHLCSVSTDTIKDTCYSTGLSATFRAGGALARVGGEID